MSSNYAPGVGSRHAPQKKDEPRVEKKTDKKPKKTNTK